MTTSPSTNSIVSASSESIDLGNARDSTALAISNVAQISGLLEDMRSNKSQWAIGDQMGIAYYFINDRLYKQCNVLNRTGARNKIEVRNQELFFEKLANVMLEQSTSFVVVQLCGKADAYLLYCHSKLQRLEPKRRVLLLGKVALVQGHVNNYYTQPTMVAPSTLIKLYGRTFNIRVNSNQHTIHMRTEDIIKNRVRLVSKQPQAGEEDAVALNAEDDESTDLDDMGNEDSEELERESDTEHSEASRASVSPRAALAGRAGRGRTRQTARRGRLIGRNLIANIEAEVAAAGNATAPAVAEEAPGMLLPGGIRVLLFRDAAVQTEAPNTEEEENHDGVRPQRPHSA